MWISSTRRGWSDDVIPCGTSRGKINPFPRISADRNDCCFLASFSAFYRYFSVEIFVLQPDIRTENVRGRKTIVSNFPPRACSPFTWVGYEVVATNDRMESSIFPWVNFWDRGIFSVRTQRKSVASTNSIFKIYTWRIQNFSLPLRFAMLNSRTGCSSPQWIW